MEEREQRIRRFIERASTERADDPTGGLARAWMECTERLQLAEDQTRQRITCTTMTGQGVRSTLLALRFGEGFVPVIESRAVDIASDGRVVVDVVGGPGDDPFYSNPAVTEQMVEDFRQIDDINLVGAIMEELPQYRLLQRGFTIASIGYWGTGIRTLNVPDEIELAIREVRSVIDYYRDELGREPALITTSLGNHLALGALGQDRLEAMQVLSLVPVMDGLQHHLEVASRNDSDPDDPLHGDWIWRNIYIRSDAGVVFDHRRMQDRREFMREYVGAVDLPWRDMELESPCSTIVLGELDPRTSAYLARTGDPAPFVKVWPSDHDVFRGAPDRARGLFSEFAECLLAG